MRGLPIASAARSPAAPGSRGPEALRGLVRSEVARWAEVVKAAGVEPQ